MIPRLDFHPVVDLPPGYDVLDFTVPASARAPRRSAFSVGRYDEIRPTLYDQPMFGGERVLHVGIDLGGPAGTGVFAFWGGRIASVADLARPGDYGPVIVTEHRFGDRTLYALHGHLARAGLERWTVGDSVQRGDRLGALGDEGENGGWPPHVHFQLSWEAPVGGDIPGVVRLDEREAARARYPDPRIVVGPLY
jgi:murein DD-endopeptidase MepM/ murein hydrolase activator NlpD